MKMRKNIELIAILMAVLAACLFTACDGGAMEELWKDELENGNVPVSERIVTDEGAVTISKTFEIQRNAEQEVTIAASPASVTEGAENITTIKFPAGSFGSSGETVTETINVVVYPTSVAAAKFTVSSQSAVAGLDLSVTVNNSSVTTFNDKVVKVTTYIAKNLTNVKIHYETEIWSNEGITSANDVDAAYEFYYNSTTGELVFGTTHFSEFLLTANAIAYVEKTNTAYETLTKAIEAASNDEIIKLIDNLNTSSQIEIAGKSIVLDMNGKAITYEKKDETTTLKSGVVLVHNGAKLTIKGNGTINAGEAYAAIALTKEGDDNQKSAELIIEDGTFIGDYYGITGNGSRDNTKITINGGTIKGNHSEDNLAVYHPQKGELIINGGTFEGYSSAIEMRAGELTINGGSFKSTASTYSCAPNGNGNTTVGAAIAIAQHSTKKDIEVTINGGEFTGVKALNESNPQKNDPAPQVKLSITGGTFNGEINITDYNSTSITGGKFSDLGGASKYVVDGATIKLSKDLTLTSRTDLGAAKTYTIDLDGHTLSSTKQCNNGSVFNVEDGNVTIQNGKLVGIAGPTGLAEPYTNECDVITSRAGSKVTLKDLNISINSTTGACVYAFANSEINIVSGTYENKTTETYANDNKMTLNQADGSIQLIFVSGGTFIGRDPAYGDNDQRTNSFLKNGFKSVPVEGESRGVGKYTVCAE